MYNEFGVDTHEICWPEIQVTVAVLNIKLIKIKIYLNLKEKLWIYTHEFSENVEPIINWCYTLVFLSN